MKVGDWARHIVTNASGEITELGEDLVTIKFVATNADRRVPRTDQEATHRYQRNAVEWIANPNAGELIVVVLPSDAVRVLEEFSMPWPRDTDAPEIIIRLDGEHILAVATPRANGRATYTRAFIVADMRNMRAVIGGGA